MALKTRLVEYKIKDDDIWCSENFINVTLNNTNNFTTEEIKNRPLVNENGRVIGVLLEADEDLLYGYVYSLGELYTRNKTNISLVVPQEYVE